MARAAPNPAVPLGCVMAGSVDRADLYDRQIRLWGHDGQRSLQEKSVVFVGLDLVSLELLKNLALAGVSRLLVVDTDRPVTAADARENFLLLPKHVSRSFLTTVCRKVARLSLGLALEHCAPASERAAAALRAADVVVFTPRADGFPLAPLDAQHVAPAHAVFVVCGAAPGLVFFLVAGARAVPLRASLDERAKRTALRLAPLDALASDAAFEKRNAGRASGQFELARRSIRTARACAVGPAEASVAAGLFGQVLAALLTGVGSAAGNLHVFRAREPAGFEELWLPRE
eukprot:gnl/Chilomastix_cuspidata/3654.p1 GENE.gnl/Chilomastix_cuspidata/3654~~gnl/Chilomastix_cuspidata/3654.p1  ORF type:complete len:288 (+),score=136.37 gnl/Chilomastix_cuspidata/3654:1316-2179(+)